VKQSKKAKSPKKRTSKTISRSDLKNLKGGKCAAFKEAASGGGATEVIVCM
jgi:hypothetical protein